METIKNYLESMFKNLPQTEAVLKAKNELGQMMEDKYTELLNEGKSENEAVGTVIAEFGNLEDLAADLGIETIYKNNQQVTRRQLSLKDIEGFLAAAKKKAYFISAGIALCISCVTGPILVDAFGGKGALGATLMFILIAAAVSLFIISGSLLTDYEYIYKEPCSVSPECEEFLKAKKRDYTSTYSIMTSVGILLCVLCIMPAMVLDDILPAHLEDISGAFFFYFIAAGVFLIVSSNKIKSSISRLLRLNTDNIIEASEPVDYKVELKESKKDLKNVKYKNTFAKTFFEVYWPTVSCIYLSVSFLTFRWYITWIIWPIAAILRQIFVAVFTEPKD